MEGGGGRYRKHNVPEGLTLPALHLCGDATSIIVSQCFLKFGLETFKRKSSNMKRKKFEETRQIFLIFGRQHKGRPPIIVKEG